MTDPAVVTVLPVALHRRQVCQLAVPGRCHAWLWCHSKCGLKDKMPMEPNIATVVGRA